MTTGKLVRMSALTAAALIIFIIEAQIPLPLPVPGIKLGFANIITLYALFENGKTSGGIRYFAFDVLMILLCRITLGAVFSGRVTAFIYSVTGGLVSFAAMLIVKRFVTEKQIWLCGAFGGFFHNAGQIAAAVFVTETAPIAALLPVLTIAGILTGIFTGTITQLVIFALSHKKE